MIDIIKAADEADMIVDGYAYKKDNDKIRVLNLNNVNKAVVFDNSGKVIETNMDDIEICIVKSYLDKNREFMEDWYA